LIARTVPTRTLHDQSERGRATFGDARYVLQLFARPLAVFAAVALCLCAAVGARAASLEPLSKDDVRFYRAAFAATDRGDFDAAEAAFANTRDKSLAGRLAYAKVMHPKAYTASLRRSHGLATGLWRRSRRRPRLRAGRQAQAAKGPAPRPPELFVASDKGPPPADKARGAREAYYSGDVVKALQLAKASGERWIAGLASYRMGQHAQAQDYFNQVASDESQDDWLRAAGSFWAARAASLAGRSGDARTLMIQAAHSPNTFYGMIAARQLALAGVALQDDPDDPIAAL
jgi:hypothetical protein